MSHSEDYDDQPPEAEDDDETPPEAESEAESEAEVEGDVEMADANVGSDAGSDAGSDSGSGSGSSSSSSLGSDADSLAQHPQVHGAALSEACYTDATSNAGDGDGSGQALASLRHHQPRAHVSHMPGYKEEFFGKGITARPPCFHHGAAAPSGWADWTSAKCKGLTPVRAMCINIPVEFMSPDATRFTHWQTPTSAAARATNVAALLGYLWTPTSKGWMYVPPLPTGDPDTRSLAHPRSLAFLVQVRRPRGDRLRPGRGGRRRGRPTRRAAEEEAASRAGLPVHVQG